MKVMIAYDGSAYAAAALDDLRRAGLPREAEALIVSVGAGLVGAYSPVAEVAGTALTSGRVISAIAVAKEQALRLLAQARGGAAHARARVLPHAMFVGVYFAAAARLERIFGAQGRGRPRGARKGSAFMSTISEAVLPGVGRKFQIETTSGDRLVIVIHDDGTRELYHFARKNMDRPASVLRLSDGEARQIAGIVGGLTYVPRGLPMAEVVLEDLVLEWFTIEPGAACVGRTIRDLEVRTRTGASIVSIIEPDQTKRTNPEADAVLNEGATLIAAGDRRTIDSLKRLLVEGKAG